MQLAKKEARRFNHEYVGTEHILLGLVKGSTGVAANVLKNLDVSLRHIRLEIETIVPSGADMVTMGDLPMTPRAKQAIRYAMEEAFHLDHNYVGTEHLLRCHWALEKIPLMGASKDTSRRVTGWLCETWYPLRHSVELFIGRRPGGRFGIF
jgi:ATP-dependent Clp protease ATP-binding subunit ClpA